MKKKQPTIKDIAEELNISFSTVSRAMANNSRISLATKQKVWDVAKRLDYTPNPAAFFLKNNKTHSIGIIIPTLLEPFFAETISGIEDMIEKKGYHSFIIQSKESVLNEIKAVETFIKMRIDGLLVSISGETNQYAHFKKLENFGIPVVFFDRVPKANDFNRIKCDTKNGAILAIDFLAKKGFKKIAFINGPQKLATSEDRLEGFLEGLKKNNLHVDISLIKNCNLSAKHTEQIINEIVNENDLPEVIFTFNNYIALYAMAACRKIGLIPNKDLFFVNFGSFPLLAYMDNPPLASIEQYPYDMGLSAAKLLLDCIEDTNEKAAYREVMIQSKLEIQIRN